MLYYIWCLERNAWWGIDQYGYVDHICDAGKYTSDEAIDSLTSANICGTINEVQIPVACIKETERT